MIKKVFRIFGKNNAFYNLNQKNLSLTRKNIQLLKSTNFYNFSKQKI